MHYHRPQPFLECLPQPDPKNEDPVLDCSKNFTLKQLREFYGPSFAHGFDDEDTLETVLETYGIRSLGELLRTFECY